jgi:aryl-alcohol dehydrogenase-like predicted oxidoreductase
MQSSGFGQTGLEVTPIGLGLAALGRPAYINLGRDEDLGDDRSESTLERRAHVVLDAAYEAGIRYVDAARSYGLAESFLASWLAARAIAPDAITVGSKWGYTYTGGWRLEADAHEVKDHSVAAFDRQLGETRAELGDHLDLYQIHSATLETGVLEDPAVLAALAKLRDRDVVVGLSVSGPRQGDVVRCALEAEVDGDNPFGSVQATWNLLEPSAGPALSLAHEAGWGVIVKEAVANGRLTPRNEERGPKGTPLTAVARRHATTMDALALAAATAQPWSDVVLSGAATVEQLTSNLQALEVELTSADFADLAAAAETPEEYWRKRAALAWS